MNKPFVFDFEADANILALLFICWKYKYPISYFLTFYEMYHEEALFVLKALSCTKKLPLNDSAFTSLILESKALHKQMIAGKSINIKINQLESLVRRGHLIDEDIPERPVIDSSEFSDDYKDFVNNYLLKNTDNIFKDRISLRLGTRELYQNIK